MIPTADQYASNHRLTSGSFYSLPYELRVTIYNHLITDILSEYDAEQLGSIFTYSGGFTSSHFRRTHVRHKERRNLWFLKVCRSSLLVSRELWSLFFQVAVPELVCSGNNLSNMLSVIRRGFSVHEYVVCYVTFDQ